MNLKDMEYFQCLCRYKNFTKAAENILNEIENMKTEINKNAGRKVKLGLPPIIGAYFFPKIMEILVKEGLSQSIELAEDVRFYIYIMKKCDRTYSVNEEKIYNKIISYKYN